VSRLPYFLLFPLRVLARGLFSRLGMLRRTALPAAIAVAAAAALIVPAGVAAQDKPPTNNELSGVVVWGIVSYTRWPLENGPMKFCLLGESAHAAVIRRAAETLQFRRAVVLRETLPTVEAVEGCDVAYFGFLPEQQTTLLLRALVGLPVLTIGEGAAFCSAGGMFCLLPDAGAAAANDDVLFATNLDVISRSSLRVTPRVLRLSRRIHGQEN
jgi:hypothetical protein